MKVDLTFNLQLVPCSLFDFVSNVESAAGLAVGLIGLPDDLAWEVRHLYNQFGEVFDRNLVARAEVDGQVTIVVFSGSDDAICGIFYVKEFAGGGTRLKLSRGP